MRTLVYEHETRLKGQDPSGFLLVATSLSARSVSLIRLYSKGYCENLGKLDCGRRASTPEDGVRQQISYMFVFLRPVALAGQCHILHERPTFRKVSTITPVFFVFV